MEIFYCDGCGRILSREEFFAGKARFIRNRPTCDRCALAGDPSWAKKKRRRRLLLRREHRAWAPGGCDGLGGGW